MAAGLGGLSVQTAHAEGLFGTCLLAQAPQTPQTSVVLVNRAPNSLGLKFDPILNLSPPTVGDTPIYISGNKVGGQTDDLIESSGSAEFRKLGIFVKADQIRQDLVQDELFAEGQVKFFRDGEYFEGPRLRLKLGTRQGYFDEVSYQMAATGGWGTADRADFVQPMETTLTNATYTTCPRDRPAWELRMKELTLDQMRETGSTRSTTLYWGDMPIVPLGDASFSIGDYRKSGFLPPSYTTSTKLGLAVTVPWYWNIAPDHDATLYPRLITKRGAQLGSEFRFLGANTLGTLTYEVLPNDSVTNTTRQFGAITTTYKPTRDIAIGLNVQRASDRNYFSDLGGSLLSSSQRLLPGSLSFSALAMGWNVRAEAQEYQLLQDTVSPLIRPYSYAPRLSVSRAYKAVLGRDEVPIDWSAGVEATSFRHPTLAEGDRYVATGSMAWRGFQQGFYVTPKVSLHATRYEHRNDGSTTATSSSYSGADLGLYENNVGTTPSYTRVLPTVSLDVNTVMDRPFSFAGLDLEQTLEPRLLYIYTPYKDQSKYPVFDSGSPSLNFAQMFSDVAFNGNDRVADLNQITAGVTTRFIEEQTGAERLRAAVGQRYYFADQLVTLPGGTVRTDRRSDLLGQVSLRPLKSLTIDSQLQYTPSSAEWQNVSLVTRYNPRPANVLSAAYRYVRGSSNTIDLAMQWPLAPYWYAVGRYQRALRDLGGGVQNQNSGLVEALAGFEYDGGCWIVRLVAQQYVTSASDKNTTLFFQFELSGLARGTSPLPPLSRGIPNYQMINQITPLPSKFDNFQ